MATKFEDQKKEIESILGRTGMSLEDMANAVAVKPETMRKISKGYQPASAQLMHSIRKVEHIKAALPFPLRGATAPKADSTLKDRFTWLSKTLLVPLEQLVGKGGKEKSFAKEIETEKVKSLPEAFVKPFCATLPINPEWLTSGTGRPFTMDEKEVFALGGAGSGVAKFQYHKVPILSWAQAGLAHDFEEIPEDWQESEMTDCPHPHAFALKIAGDSMEPRYQAGDIAVLLPQVPPRDGDLVIARLARDGVVFKKFNLVGSSGEEFQLTSFNESYPPMKCRAADFDWIYPIYSVTKRLRADF